MFRGENVSFWEGMFAFECQRTSGQNPDGSFDMCGIVCVFAKVGTIKN